MNTWVFILFAVSSTTTVQSNGYQDSAPAAVEYPKEYSSRSPEKTAGEGSPRIVFIYPPDGGSTEESHSALHEETKNHGPVNRPGILHSRYQASSSEGESSKSSQMNSGPLQSQRRDQDDQSQTIRREDSGYYDSMSDYPSLHNGHPSNINDQLPSESAPRATYVLAPGNGNHEDMHDGHQDNLNNHHSRSNPSVYSTRTSHPHDRTFEESSPRGTYVLPPKAGNHEQSFDMKYDDLKYHKSDKVPLVVPYHQDVSPNTREQSSDQSSHHSTLSHILRREEIHNEPQSSLKYHIPTSYTSDKHQNSFSFNPNHHSINKSSSKDSYGTQYSELHYDSPSNNHSVVFHTGISSYPHDKFSDNSEFRGVHSSYEGTQHKIHDARQGEFKYRTPTNNQPTAYYSSILKDLNVQPSDKSSSRVVHSSYERNPQKIHDEQQKDFTYHPPASYQEIAHHSSPSSNPIDQPSEKTAHRHVVHTSYERKPQQFGDGQQRELNYLTPTNKPPTAYHESFSKDHNNQQSEKTASSVVHSSNEINKQQVHGGHQADFTYHPPASDQEIAYRSSISSKPTDQPSEQTAHHVVHSSYERTPQQIRDGQQREFSYQTPTNNPPTAYHNSISKDHNNLPLDKTVSRVVHSSYERNQQQVHEGQLTDLTYDTPASDHKIAYHTGISSNLNDQPSQKSESRVVYSTYEGNQQQIRDRPQSDFKYHTETNDSPVVYRMSSNHHDQISEHSKSHRASSDQRHEETRIKYDTTTSSPSVVSHGGYSSHSNVQSYEQFGPHGSEIRDVRKGERHELGENYRPISSSVSQHNKFPSKTTDQSSDHSFSHTTVVEPTPEENYRQNHDEIQDRLRHASTPSPFSAAIHDGYHQKVEVDSDRRPDRFMSGEENTETPRGFGYHQPTTIPDKPFQYSYNDVIGPKNNHQYDHGKFSDGEIHKAIKTEQFEQFKNKHLKEFPRDQKDSIEIMHERTNANAHDKTVYKHGNDISGKFVSVHNGRQPVRNQEYEYFTPIHVPKSNPKPEYDIPVIKSHNGQPAKDQYLPKYQQMESHNTQGVAEPSGHTEIQRGLSGYVPYSGPYTKPQVLHDGPTNNEFAYVVVEPSGMPKAQPPREFHHSSYLNNTHNPSGSHRPDNHYHQAHSHDDSQHVETQNNPRIIKDLGFTENRYSPFVPLVLNDYSTGSSHVYYQRQNTTQIEHSLVTAKPQTHSEYIRKNEHGYHDSSEKKTVPEVNNERPRPEVHKEWPRPEVHNERPRPEVHNERPRPEVHNERPRPEVHSERPRPEVHNERPRPEVHNERLHPEVHNERPRPDVHNERSHTEVHSERPRPEVHNERPRPYSYHVSDGTSHMTRDTFNDHNPHNYTRDEQIGIPSWLKPKTSQHPRDAEYMNHPNSNHNYYQTGKHHSSDAPHVSSQLSDADLQSSANSIKSSYFLPLSGPELHRSHLNDNSYNGGNYSSGPVRYAEPYQEHLVQQVPVPTSNEKNHDGHNDTNLEHFNAETKPLYNGRYHYGNDHIYPLGQTIDSRIQKEYIYQPHSNTPFTNPLLQQSSSVYNIPVVNPIRDNLNPEGTIQANAQYGSVRPKIHPLVNYLHHEIHPEYVLPINEPKAIAQALHLIPNCNQSEHLTDTPATQISPGYIDTRNPHPSGLSGYIDTQHRPVAHIPYHTLPVGKPVVVHSGYQEDTHEISHAKHEHLHVHRSSQSGYQYGIIN